MKHFGFKKRGRSVEKNDKQKPDNSDDTQISRPDLLFASREAANQHKKGPEPHQKSPHQNHQDCLRHDRDKPTVSPKYAQNELASLWPKQKGGEKLCNCEKQQQNS